MEPNTAITIDLNRFSTFLTTFGKSIDFIFSSLNLLIKNISCLKTENKDLKEQMKKTHHEYLVLLQMLSNIFAMISEIEVNMNIKKNPNEKINNDPKKYNPVQSDPDSRS